MAMAVSAVVLTKNEEKNTEECLKTLKWVDEVIVVDDGSMDRTVEIAKENGAKVFEHSLNNDFAQQRNFGLEQIRQAHCKQAQDDWVFFIDADERISPQLRAEIVKVTGDGGPFNGFFLKREDKIWGRVLRHGETANVKLLRLAKKGKGEWERPVHEVWQIRGEIGELKSPLQHYPHPTVSQFLEEINFYSTIRARELYEQGERTNLLEILVYPKAKFLKNYFWYLGFLDGMSGFVVALLMSFHSFLVRAKLYLLWKQEGEWK